MELTALPVPSDLGTASPADAEALPVARPARAHAPAARRGAQFSDPRLDRLDPTLLYIVPRFSFTPLGDAVAQDNLFIYPQFALQQPWMPGKTSATARVTFWAVAHETPWPLAESEVTVVRTSVVNGARRPIDERGYTVTRPAPGTAAARGDNVGVVPRS